jgi:hypothetical protein
MTAKLVKTEYVKLTLSIEDAVALRRLVGNVSGPMNTTTSM